MENKSNGSYFTRVFFSIVFVLIMLAALMYGVYRGSDYFVKYRSEYYQKYWGYMQDDNETEYLLVTAAQNIAESVSQFVSQDGEENEYDLDQDPIGIHQLLITDDCSFKRVAGSREINKYTWISDFDKDNFFKDKIAAFSYDGTEAYLKYTDGRVEEYTNGSKMEMIDKYMDKICEDFQTSGGMVYVWADEDFYNSSNPGMKNMNLQSCSLKYIIAALGVSAAALVMASLLSVRTRKGMMRKRRVFTELPVIITGLGLLGAYLLLDYLWEFFDTYNQNVKATVTVLSCVIAFIIYLCIRECVIKVKEGRFWKDSCLVRLVKWVWGKCRTAFKLILKKSNYKDFSITKKLWIRRILFMIVSMIYIVLASIFCNGFGISAGYDSGGYYYEYVDLGYIAIAGGIYLILFLIYSFYEMRFLKSLNDVYKQIDDIYHGEYAIREVEKDDLTFDITQKLNRLSNGLEDAIEKRISSEKMKVELITNVSHDLKTPLTSIISYVDLLKEEEMTDVAAAYVKILEEKSYQLRNIVSDVFELARANSGQDVEIETIDGVMLINQVLADMGDTIERSGKMIKADIKPETFFIKGDGKKLYRALQNLIDNALKYSLEGTRIYINSGVNDNKLKLVIKNIAAYEMNFSGEDIVERFVRGDESRTTEGNGLGLSIAKSFIEVSGGTMSVEVDGDVFKVTVEF